MELPRSLPPLTSLLHSLDKPEENPADDDMLLPSEQALEADVSPLPRRFRFFLFFFLSFFRLARSCSNRARPG